MKKRRKIGLVVDFSKKGAAGLAKEVKDWLKKKDCLVLIKAVSDLTPSILKDLDFVVTFGGDGTVLRTANAVAPHNIPMVRVNFGTVGYLCNVKPDQVFQALEKILANQFRLEIRTRIKAEIFKGKALSCSFDAFNEIIVGSTPEKKTAWLQAQVIDMGYERIVRVAADGLIIATKSGSTGYCLNAGGPALLQEAFAVVASNGYFESGFLPSHAKSFVVSCDAKFEITILRGGPNLPCVVADSDSQRTRLLEEGERVVISKSPLKNLFIEFLGGEDEKK